MKWLRHRKARLDRDSGMVFAWRGMHSRLGSTLTAALVVGVCAAAFASLIKVRVLSPPARSERRGSVIVALDHQAAQWLDRRGAELTPFPGPLDVWRLDEISEALEKHPALSGEAPGSYVPRLRPMPEASNVERLPVGEAGRMTLPPLPALPPPAGAAPPARRSLRPVLEPDSADLAARVRVPMPEFRPGGDSAAGEFRFLLEVAADGCLGSVMALDSPQGTPVAELEAWLRGVSFEPSEVDQGWFAVTVRVLSSDG